MQITIDMSLNLKKLEKELDDALAADSLEAKQVREDFEIWCLFDEARYNCPWKCETGDEQCVCMKEAKKVVLNRFI